VEWDRFINLLWEKYIDLSFAVAVCYAKDCARVSASLDESAEQVALGRSLGFPYSYTSTSGEWGILPSAISFPAFSDTLARYQEHVCSSREICHCLFGYFCQGCQQERLVEGRDLEAAQEYEGRCLGCRFAAIYEEYEPQRYSRPSSSHPGTQSSAGPEHASLWLGEWAMWDGDQRESKAIEICRDVENQEEMGHTVIGLVTDPTLAQLFVSAPEIVRAALQILKREQAQAGTPIDLAFARLRQTLRAAMTGAGETDER
jgi:hypothetical protein